MKRRTELEDISQTKVVIHAPQTTIEKLCTKIRKDLLKGLKNLNFSKLTKVEKNKLEESVYAMMADYKHTPLEVDETMSKELYKIVEDKWYFFLQMEKDIREYTLI